MDGTRTSDFDYVLPKRLIAQRPLKHRDHSRLMVLDKLSGSIEHRRFFDLPDFLNEGDVLVFNDSRVVPARLVVEKERTQTKIEILLLQLRPEFCPSGPRNNLQRLG